MHSKPFYAKKTVKQDRFLLIILGIIGLLVVTALVVFFLRRNAQAYGLDDTPEGVIRNYVLALNLGDYEKAYAYIATKENKPAFEDFEQSMTRKRPELLQTSVRILSTEIEGDQATAVLSITQENSDPFDPPRSYAQNARLILQEGAWKLTQMPYSFWH